jgi:hypothetical protein
MDEEDQVALILLIKLMHNIIELNHGFMIEHKNKKYLIHKCIKDNQTLIDITEDTFDENVKSGDYLQVLNVKYNGMLN